MNTKKEMKLIPLGRVPIGSRCVHSGLVAKPNKKNQRSPYDDAGIEFAKTCDAYQTTKEGDEVIFGVYDLVTVVTWGNK